jgi:TPR repeat protein
VINTNRSPERRQTTGYGIMMMSQHTESLMPLPGPDSSGDELFRMGMLYSTGQGGAPLDYVSAHMLFNLAAMRGSMEAKLYRKELSQEMASDEVAEAQRQAREWLARA